MLSFNFGVQQSKLTGSKQWSKHATKMSALLGKFADGASADVIFGCEVGTRKQGLRMANVDFNNVLHHHVPGASWRSSGA